jgi:hypothetical protein
MSVGHSFQDILEVGEGLDVVELCCGDEGTDGRPARGTSVGSGEQVVLAAQRDGAHGSFDGVGVEFDAAVIEEAAKGIPAGQGVADGISQAAARRDLGELRLKPGFHRSGQRSRVNLSRALPNGGCLARMVVSNA